MNKAKRILICPLDWGLGHATRCIPIIDALLQQGAEVLVGGTPVSNKLVREYFPGLQFLEFPPYAVRYSKRPWMLPFSLLMQMPRIFSVVRAEHHLLHRYHQQYQFDAVISDNRFGLYSNKVITIFITHQVRIAVPASAFFEQIINSINRRFIHRFSQLWIPDDATLKLSGTLSDTNSIRIPFFYTGILSRFEMLKSSPVWRYKIIIMLSGPEPQRSIWEQNILRQAVNYEERILICRGLPGNSELPEVKSAVEIVNHLDGTSLNEAISQSQFIVCRSGYSSVMDLVKIGRTALLVPTPGQTEQEYLAAGLNEKKLFCTISQNAFDLQMVETKIQQLQRAELALPLRGIQELVKTFLSGL